VNSCASDLLAIHAGVYEEVHGLIASGLILMAWGWKSRLAETSLKKQFGAEYALYRTQ